MLRTNLNKCKRAITRFSWEAQPPAPGEQKPTRTAQEKASFIAELLSHQRAARPDAPDMPAPFGEEVAPHPPQLPLNTGPAVGQGV